MLEKKNLTYVMLKNEKTIELERELEMELEHEQG